MICSLYIFVNPGLSHQVFITLCTVILILLSLLLIEILWWAHMDGRECDSRHREFIRECEKLETRFRKIILRAEIWKVYLDSFKSAGGKT